MIDTSLNLKVLQCVDAGLDSLGRGSNVVYWYLTQKLGLRRDAIPDDPIAFVGALRTLFGQGAEILEKVIVREMERAFNISTQGRLVDALSAVKGKPESGGAKTDETETPPTAQANTQPTRTRARSRKTG